MEVVTAPNTLVFNGPLVEGATVEMFSSALDKLIAEGCTPPIRLDFSNSSTANSVGLIIFLRFLGSTDLKFTYVNCPVWLVNQLNLINQFLDRGNTVESIQIPYYCAENDTEKTKLVYIGTDIPIRQDYNDFVLGPWFVDAKKYDPDVDPGIYLSFISANYRSFEHLIDNNL